ncbi:hypothetical protein [Paenirhodobacter enshiensis]|uniref:Uncharacterized protein n=1 Tax=Paenirhodobacter enshiensis TaxID=1105367 RepID=A0A086XQN7_9RHOB|nr:hypothetical protein [Paenirhodobacter enshiensis]KFI24337.1 hypothetical protein CG50_10845 [Paenirhodobacter enshiensis]
MDSTEQATGEKRVRRLLIEALELRGLARPSTLTRAQYEAMCADLCQRLAYMTEASLMALEEQVASNPAGKDRDRMPISNRILEWAGQIQPPEDGASPLMRAVFGHDLGATAIAEGWAPELMTYLRDKRMWPTPYAVTMIREKADGPRRQMLILEERIGYGYEPGADDRAFLARRRAAVEKCRRVAELAAAGA